MQDDLSVDSEFSDKAEPLPKADDDENESESESESEEVVRSIPKTLAVGGVVTSAADAAEAKEIEDLMTDKEKITLSSSSESEDALEVAKMLVAGGAAAVTRSQSWP